MLSIWNTTSGNTSSSVLLELPSPSFWWSRKRRASRSIAQAEEFLQLKINQFSEGLTIKAILDKSPEFNAYAIMQGEDRSIAVTTGALEMTNLDQLQFILAHEVAHHLCNHSTTSAIGGMLATTAVDFLGASDTLGAVGIHDASGSQIIKSALHGLALAGIQYQSRAQEFEADARALEMLRANGVDTSSASSVFQMLLYLEGSSGPFDRIQQQLFGSHPLTSERLERVSN